SYTIHRSGRRYAYYISQALLQNAKERAGSVPRVRAEEIERLVFKVTGEVEGAATSDPPPRSIERIVIFKDRVEIVKASAGEEEGATIVVPVKLSHRNRARVLDDGTARPDPTIVRAMARAHEWRGWLEQDEVRSFRDIANKADVD